MFDKYFLNGIRHYNTQANIYHVFTKATFPMDWKWFSTKRETNKHLSIANCYTNSALINASL